MFKEKIIRIAITGPESTGKSSLARQLAAHYQTVWVSEYARDYIQKLNRPYEKQDLVDIAKGQISHEDEQVSKANNYLFCDTELTVLKIWSEYKYGSVDPYIISEYTKRSYDKYLLMDIDLPWEYDIQREHPQKRKYFFDRFEKELTSKCVDYEVIGGSYRQRFENACQVIDDQFKSSNRL